MTHKGRIRKNSLSRYLWTPLQIDEQPARCDNFHIQRENKKEKTHEHKREEHNTGKENTQPIEDMIITNARNDR